MNAHFFVCDSSQDLDVGRSRSRREVTAHFVSWYHYDRKLGIKRNRFLFGSCNCSGKELNMSTIISACWRGSDELLSRVHGSRQ